MALKTTAQTKEDVDAMSVRDRLWDSMNFTYGQKQNQSNAAYDKAISQNDRAMLARGMQRSSYGAQTRTNLMNQKVDAANAIESEKIADYENRLYQVERDEIEDAFKNKQFDEGVRQFNENLAFQQSEAQRAQGNFEVQQAFQEKQWAAQQAQWKAEFNYTKKSNDQKLAYDYVVSIVANGKTPSASLLKRAGLSKSDANKMKKAVSSGGYYKKPAAETPKATKPPATDDSVEVPIATPAGANGGNPPSTPTLGSNGVNYAYGSSKAKSSVTGTSSSSAESRYTTQTKNKKTAVSK